MSVTQQASIFTAMALGGMGAGVLHDLLGVFRHNTWCAAAADLALGILCAAGMVCIALHLRCEVFRLYTFLGVALGWTIYAVTFGAIVRMLRRKFIKLSKKVES